MLHKLAVCFVLMLCYRQTFGSFGKSGFESPWRSLVPLEGHIAESIAFAAKVEVDEKEKCPGHGCKKTSIAEVA